MVRERGPQLALMWWRRKAPLQAAGLAVTKLEDPRWTML